MKNRMKWIFLIILFCGFMSSFSVSAKEIPDELKNLYARSAVLMDADSGRILFGKNEKDILPMASTTKIMTCILALENMKDEQICEVSKLAALQPKVHLGMKRGEKYYLIDLLYSLMLESHNDSAVAIAEAIAGSVEEFAMLMNKKAQEIGCMDTYFITPNGLDAENEIGVHSTTASDLALIMRYCTMQSVQKDKFIEITQKKDYEFYDESGKRRFSCQNHNAFLNMMEGAFSGKTGFTNAAGYCYVGALKQGDRTFIVALLACGWPNNKGYKWKDTRKLMMYGLENYHYKNIVEDIECSEVLVENAVSTIGLEDVYIKTGVYHKQDIDVMISNMDQIDVRLVQQTKIKAPVKKKQQIGKLYYFLNGEIIKEMDIVTMKGVDAKTIFSCFRDAGNIFLL